MSKNNFKSKNFKVSARDVENEKNLNKKISMLQCFAQQSRLEIFDMIHERGNGHWGGSASSAELLTTLYFHVMNLNPENPKWEDRDRLVLSKGHAAPMLYNLLAHKGFFPVEELSTFRTINSRLQGHPCMLKTPGVELSTGPLGHGISVGVGMALAAQIKQKSYWTFVIVGDGCLNEGESWEGIMSAAKYKPARLVIMVDYNKVQLDGKSEDIMPLDPLIEKFEAFNLKVAPKVYNGHQVDEIIKSFAWAYSHQKEPCVIVYKTHKGKGVSFMEDNYVWHGCPIDDVSYDKGKIELQKSLIDYENEIK